MHNNLLLAQPSDEKLYVEDVFSTWLYTGNGSTQTITNGIDLAGKGGLVWLKDRTSANPAWIMDTLRGTSSTLQPSSTNGAGTISTAITAFNANGFAIGANGNSNTNNNNYASWTFRKAPKFFDVVTYTGNGVAGRTLNHSLGTTPGMILFKCTSLAQNWWVWHRSKNNGDGYLVLNATSPGWNGSGILFGDGTTYSAPTATTFTISSYDQINGNGNTYVAYLFAHNSGGFGADGAQNVISCGSFTTSNGFVNLDFEPQFFLYKNVTDISDWIIADNMRGWNVYDGSNTNGKGSNANTNGGEYSWYLPSPGSKGVTPIVAGTYIYLAIRRGPMRVPTDATKVFKPITKTGDAPTATLSEVGFQPDWVYSSTIAGTVYGGVSTYSNRISNRLTGFQASTPILQTHLTSSETQTGIHDWNNQRFSVNNGWGTTTKFAWYFMCRAPGFFDCLCYTGTGAALPVSHNLGVAPELIIVKARNVGTATFGDWVVQSSYLTDGFAFPAGHVIRLNKTNASAQDGYIYNVSSSSFTVGGSVTSGSGTTYVAYLFASCPGVSKVGSYTGNGSSLNIDCGFTNGARFVLIKRTNSTGDWFTFDTARGIVTANDPHLSLNTAVAEVTTNDSIDPLSSGFTVNQVAATNINVSGGTYIYLAIA